MHPSVPGERLASRGASDRTATTRAIATAGNAVFVAFLAAALSHDRLFVVIPPPPPSPAVEAAAPRPAARVLLVVVDGLRADTAADATLMPTLDRLRAGGRSGTVRVQSLIPSTVAGVVSLATGATAPPIAVLQDFRALPAADGGVFERVRNAGGRSFVAGPPVWGDLYGKWIDEFVPLEALANSDDGPIAAAAVAATAAVTYRLVVLHLGRPDDVAHAFGARSAEYADAAREADAAIARLLPHVRGDDLIIVTADHGNTVPGGHAGPEADVLDVPLVIAGAGGGELPVRLQPEISQLVAQATGVSGTSAASAAPSRRRFAPLAMTPVCCVAALLICVSGGRGARLPPTVLNAAVWPVLAFAALGWRGAALALAGAALAAGVFLRGDDAAPAARAGCPAREREGQGWSITAAVALGMALGAARLTDGTSSTWTSGAARNAALATSIALGYAAGRAAAGVLRRHPHPAFGIGAGIAVAIPVLGRLAGQTVSLSTLDVRAAYALSESMITLPVAIAVIALIHAAPVLALVAGIGGAVRQLPTRATTALATGAAAVFVGQLFTTSTVLATVTDVPAASLAMSGLLRTAIESLYFFLALLLAVMISTPTRRPQP